MLSCYTCMRHCLQTILGDSAILASSRISSPLIRTAQSRWTARRTFTLQANTPPRSRRLSEHSATGLQSTSLGQSERKNRRQEWLDSRGVRPVDRPLTMKDYEIRKTLKYLKDPLKLAERVRRSLWDDDFDNTLATVRAASKDVLCTVSWNHLIDWQLSKGKMNAAIKTYNEMKKRAQVPDAYTYTIIFRGCAEHPDSALALTKVMSIYQGMLSDKSPIKPNVIHLNSLLKMCARANDLDTLFAIANNLPDYGIGTPDKMSYTIIINAIRMHLLMDIPEGQTPVQQQAERRKAITNARHIWADVTARWRKGDILIDEELVCSMGRILILGEPSDADDVLSLIEQTMNMPRQIPRLGTPERALIDPASQGGPKGDQSGIVGSVIGQNVSEEISGLKPGEQTEQTMGITTSTPAKTPALGLSVYARPGRNSLSLIMKALLELELKKPAVQYWDIFTKDLGVIPDSENFHSYLRILRLGRASTQSTELVRQMPKEFLEYKTFRIAMATCDRDKHNIHAFSNAGKLLDIMQMHLNIPDIPALQMYLNVATTTQVYSRREASDGKADSFKHAQGRQILRALGRLNPSFLNLRSLLAYGDPTDQQIDKRRNTTNYMAQVTVLAQKMIRATDILLNKAMVRREMYSILTQRRSKLSAFVTRHKHQNTQLGNQVRPEAEENDNDDVTSPKATQNPGFPAISARLSKQEAYRAQRREPVLGTLRPPAEISSRW